MTSIYLQPQVLEALRRLAVKRDQSVAALLREAVGDLLAKYKVHVPLPKVPRTKR